MPVIVLHLVIHFLAVKSGLWSWQFVAMLVDECSVAEKIYNCLYFDETDGSGV